MDCIGTPFVAVSRKTPFGAPNILSVARSQTYDICDNTYEFFDFFTVGEDIYRRKTAIEQSLTARVLEGRKMYRSVTECELRLRRLGNAYVKKNQ